MGSSDDPNCSNVEVIDATVGSLVWVRRRNGSWWPGRIMGLDEISEDSLVSPKSGTPVKLLGRDDASVDWYNLEKSKRVKAFRCGEYDECIEKAKAYAANGKKAVKYARREDAILHALEIENAHVGKDCLIARIDNSGVELGTSKESPSMSLSGKVDDENMSDEKSDPADGIPSVSSLEADSGSESGSAPELSQSGISFEDPNHVSASKLQLQGKRRRTPNDSEDDGTEGIKRMKGLEDIGVGVGDSNTRNGMPNGCAANGIRGNNSLKRKRSQVANVQELLKRKNRSRPLTKVLESTAMVPVPAICDQVPSSNGSPHQGLSDSKVSGIESNEPGKDFLAAVNDTETNGVSCENGTSFNPSEHPSDASHVNCKVKENDIPRRSELADSLLDVPFTGEEKRSAGFSPVHVPSSSGRQGESTSQSSQAEAVSLKNEGLHEAVSISSAAAHVSNVNPRIEKGTSKWQSKGKRNSRRKSKNRKQASRKYVGMDDEGNGYLGSIGQKVNCGGTRRSLGLYGCNLQMKSKSFTGYTDGVPEWNKSLSHRELNMRVAKPEVSVLPQRSLPYRQSRFTVNSRYEASDFPGRNFCHSTKLYDVKLDVKANYIDVKANHRPQHVPLVSLMSKLNGKAIIGHPLMVEPLSDGYCDGMIGDKCDETYATDAGGRTLIKKMSARPRFSPSKSPKLRKSGGLLSKKIRKLSSLTSNKEESRKPVVEKPMDPVIACIPLKLVFSRINEAVNGSARQANRALT